MDETIEKRQTWDRAPYSSVFINQIRRCASLYSDLQFHKFISSVEALRMALLKKEKDVIDDYINQIKSYIINEDEDYLLKIGNEDLSLDALMGKPYLEEVTYFKLIFEAIIKVLEESGLTVKKSFLDVGGGKDVLEEGGGIDGTESKTE